MADSKKTDAKPDVKDTSKTETKTETKPTPKPTPKAAPQAPKVALDVWAKDAGLSVPAIALVRRNCQPSTRLTRQEWLAKYNKLLTRRVG